VSIYVHKSHNVNVLIYHLVFPTKYRRLVVDDKVDQLIKDICPEIGKWYEIYFVEIGTDKDHMHFFYNRSRN
jgi:REP element-mobilizing transposase RayT